MRFLWIIVVLACARVAPGNAVAEPVTEEGATVITSDKLTFDYQSQYAVFEDDVVVVDADLRLTADKLAIWFNEENEITLIKAEGNVNIVQKEKTAMAGEAVYEVDSGKITLTDHPRLQRGRHYLEGTKIIYWRDKDLLVCEPEPRLVIYPDDVDGADTSFFGE